MNYAQPTARSGTELAPFKPMAPYDDRPGGHARDFAAAGAFSLYALERMLRDITEQPNWRWRAKLCGAYYDGKQLDELKRWALGEEDLEERVVNLIRPIVNNVLGQEARSRTDVRVEADDDAYADVCEAVNHRLKEAERETGAHQAVSDAYAGQVKKGLGWVHVCKNADPGLYPYRVEEVPLDEIWWDWRGMGGRKHLDDRCRWLCRMRMTDLDEVIAVLPQHREILELTAAGWDDPRLETMTLLGEPEATLPVSSFQDETRFNSLFRKYDWIDSARRMVKLIEVWYRVPAMGVFLELGPTRRVPYNANDPRHVEAVARGLLPIVKGPTSQVRRALYAGPHRLLDTGTNRKHFPYIPFFAYRDDDDHSPYGLIDGMIAPQDDYNDARHRIQWMRKARQMFIDSDALDSRYNTIKEVAGQVMRPDLLAVLNPNRRNGANAIKIGQDLQLEKEQYEMLQRAEDDIQKAAGRYQSNLGDAQVQSGIANQLLIEQGEQSMGELNDNYTTSRRRVFEQLVDLIVEDHKKPDMKVAIGQGKARRVIVLNTWQPPMQEVQDPQTGEVVEQPVPGAPPQPTNMVCDAEIRTGLAETPNTPAYRQQTQQQLKEILTALGNNPQATALLAPAYIESTSLPDRAEVADDLRRITGQPPKGDRKQRQQAERAQQAAAAEAQAIAKQKEVAEANKHVAEGKLKNAQARKTNAEAEALERKLAAGGVELEAQRQAIDNATAVMGAGDEDAEIDGAINEAMSAVG